MLVPAPAPPTVKVLIVDDQPANLLALEVVLQEIGATLVRAGSGEEALARTLQDDFAAILLDIRMPGMDGFEAARLIRSRPRSRTTPILFVTASDSAELYLEDAYALGAVDFLTKPLHPAALKGKVSFFIELQRSRDELRAAERQAVNERAFLSAVLEAVQDGIVACDPHGALTLFNRATRELHGLPAAPLPATRWPEYYDLYRPDGHTPLWAQEIPLVRALAGERVRNVEMVVAPRNGPRRTLVASGQTLYDPSTGAKLGAVVSMHDVTAEREADAARAAALREQARREQAEATAELLRVSEERLRRLAEQLAESDRRKTEFLATLAHELRNPLAPLRNGLHLMQRAQEPEVLERTRDMMERQLSHMVRLIDDLLDIARVTSGKVELKKERIDLRQVVDSAVEISLPTLEAAGHRLEVRLPPEPLPLDVDPTRIAQVLGNLLNNAAKYTPDDGQVVLQARRQEGQVVISVTDSGVGIPAEALPRVFEMFTQVGRNGDRSQGGLGIGLALVRALVELHGGTVTASSAGPGRGSTFTVQLPLAADLPAAEAAPAPGADGAAAGESLQVLVVDDNQDAAESLAMILEMSGHRARVAHDGDQALALAREFRPQVVFLDIGMPGKNGYEVAREMRQQARKLGRQPVLVALTGWGGQDDLARSRAAGFDHHLTKPADIAAVENLLAGLEPAV
ncbi:hybrid sensor histidine kinase/response regulator [Ramlibacter tataouinensis]|uniref:histidine kinase n=1 Tax=Ramlibacter tataouinensis (strain ATCC BAA-407 / DSM 14655 / LMG 21543 / TTB310) TaxID=365046 RepID=F5XYK3_RAMTT|nr:response regulator [Ramlibacter tataouinensis]AEG93179.1 candidate histidine kinase, atypical hybrid [Ramlibacter tataouinensis TTB310]